MARVFKPFAHIEFRFAIHVEIYIWVNTMQWSIILQKSLPSRQL